MASDQSPLFATSFSRISALLFWVLLIARADAQTGKDDVAVLGGWKSEIFLDYDGIFDFNPGGYFDTWNLSDANPCAWAGVTCTANLTVEALDLSGWELPRWVLGELTGLRDLRRLDLSSSNFLIGEDILPSNEIGSLAGLTHLDLSQSGLQGTIPADISKCTGLRYLSFEQNLLSGEIPSLRSLVNLQFLLLADNNLTGPIPEISSLVKLDLSDNKFSGTFPSLSNFPNLMDLNLDNNNFTALGELLSSNTNRLERLFVSGNQLGGTIPTHITDLLNLQVLNMSRNQLSGIPSGFSRLWNSNLTSVDLSQNNLSGNVPADFLLYNSSTGFRHAVAVNLSHNLLSGSLPLDFGQFARHSIVDISHNQLSGPVPLMLTVTQDKGIDKLWLHNNQLSGDIVDVLVQAADRFIVCNLYMSELHLENNRFTGDLSRMLGKWLNMCLTVVDLSNNYLRMSTTEAIPDPLGATLQNFADNLMYSWYLQLDQPLSIQLHLAGNDFSGTSLPTTCFNGTSSKGNYFQALDISNNSLQGEILGEVFNGTCLPQLQFLNLSHNNVSGPVPQSIFTLPNLLVLDFSSNNLSGPLPTIQPSSPFYDQRIFANNTGLCGDPLPPCPSGIPRSSRGVPWWVLLIIVAVSVISIVGSCVVAACVWRVYQEKHRQDADLIKTLMDRESATLMPLSELKKATNNFSKSAQVGEGGFGTVYVGKLSDGTTVAIKKSKREGTDIDKDQFLNEVKILSQVNHRCLVKLLGCCMENKISLLVFEFVSNGTLEDHLRGKTGTTHLSWTQRLNIAVQTADALSYLHSGTTSPIYHRDVKSANILLDNDCNAKVADFGISKLAPRQATHVSLTNVAIHGTFGYMDPEYYTSLQLTGKSDVYSFGVVLLELISAKPAIDGLRGEDEAGLVNFVRPYVEKGDVEQVIDPTLMETYLDPISRGRESVLNVGRLAIKCLNRRPKARPSMDEVWKELHNLWLEFITTSQHLNSIDEDENKASESHRVRLLFESISSDGAEFTVGSTSGSIQMSQFSPQ